MKTSTGLTLGAAILTGYALGRKKKGRVALLAAAGVMGAQAGLRGRRIPLLSAPIDLAARQAGRLLKDTATTALTSRATKLSDALHDRTDTLRQAAAPSGDEEEEEQAPEPEESADDHGGGESGSRPSQRSAPRSTAKRAVRRVAAQGGGK